MTMGGGVEVKYHSALAPELDRYGQRHAPFALPSRKESIPVVAVIKSKRSVLDQALY
jgi:hypothetical protein